MSHTFFARAIPASVALLSLAACRGRSPDAGGDTSLARDLAEVQLAGADSVAALRTVTESATVAQANDSAVAHSSNGGALASDSPASVTPSTRPSHAIAAPSPMSRRSRSSPGRRSSANQCASPAAADQTACLIAATARSNSRLGFILREITVAVRRQQRVAARAVDPAYVGELRKAQARWVAWRGAECRSRSASSGKLWGAQRATCLSAVTDARAAELDRILAQVRGH